jgi:tRNA threonylcarbamoyladenosine biosynthesis protein TsaE
LRSRSAEATREAARRLAEAIEAVEETRSVGFVIGLVGPLGAGKTEWVKGLAAGLGVAPELVASPTFVIASEYPGRRPLVHADFYRIESEGELEAAGFLDWLDPGRIVAIEWADRFPRALPADHVEVRLSRDAARPDARDLQVRAAGPIAARVVERFVSEMAAEREEGPASWR